MTSSWTVTLPWRVCPDCGIGPGEDHKPRCPGAVRPTPRNYSGTVRVTRVVKKRGPLAIAWAQRSKRKKVRRKK